MAISITGGGGGGGGGTPRRAQATLTDLAAAPGEVIQFPMPLAPSYALLGVGANKAGVRVRVYTDAAAQSGDAARPIGTPADASTGLVMEYLTADALTHQLNPVPVGTTASPDDDIHVTVDNDPGGGDVTVTFDWLRLEGNPA